MSRIVLTRILVPAATVCTVIEYKCKASELPIYMPDLDGKTWKGNCPAESASHAHPPPTLVEEAVGSIRKQLVSVCTEVGVYKESVVDVVDSCAGQVTWLRNYLADEDNVAPKPGAIGIGALTGFVFGLRGGLIRRVVFTGAGALAMTALCYPRQAADYSKLGLRETKKYITIGYNFVYGVKKGDTPLELPSAPASVDDAWLLIRTSGSTAIASLYSTVTSLTSTSAESVCLGKSGSDDEVDMAALLILDPNLDSRLQRSQTAVEQLHDDAAQVDCHCPVGTCLSPHDDNEGGQTGSRRFRRSADGQDVELPQGDEECCVCVCDDDD